ncbi:MAG TPA: cob(I)yrinic acid a,c-diamide adenosyltransferase [candidate division Zixibacteria bacterium]|nr:cob(I)yrinic acid a,c-diamide adenosyltransferase [candidate division Zixibacteria bacterium]
MAIRITRVYTRGGDTGQTSLVGGKRVAKDSPRIEAYGTVDELNSVVGLARAFNAENLAAGEAHRFVEEVLCRIQDELFDVGSELATPPESYRAGMVRIGAGEVARLEKLIDRCQVDLDPLPSFVLPGGSRVGAALHQCRTVCRRAEREILRLSRTEPVGPGMIQYFNRLSDLFFVLSRWINKQTGHPEILWRRGLAPKPRQKK